MSYRTVISVRGLGKRYELGETFSENTARDALGAGMRRLLRASAGAKSRKSSEFWALKDVTFDVAEGEVLGIVGANGAGKSTLLKILSQITEPTTGEVRIRGRVASLLEVGTGFHQELSGRENVFMNGAILGMRQGEIRRKFDEIVGFAGVEPFIDTPVKRYSSGMLVLGFAVAAHLEPEILIVDEVLAVGDEAFQKRCVQKMNEVSRSGRTVLFVSHQMAAVEALCTRGILLREGSVRMSGPPDAVIAAYRAAPANVATAAVDLADHLGRPNDRPRLMRRVSVRDSGGRHSIAFVPGETVTLAVDYAPVGREISPVLGVVIKSDVHGSVFAVDNRFIDGYRLPRTAEGGTITCSLPDLPLAPGSYTVDLYLGDALSSLDLIRDAVAFQVVQADVYGTGRMPAANAGPVLWKASWKWEPTAPKPSVRGDSVETA